MKVLAVTTTFTSLAAVFMAARLWTRFRLVKASGYDDLLVTAALICSIVFFAFILVERNYGLGVPISKIPPEVVQTQLRYLWLSIPFYNLSLVLAKLSALFLYLRIFRSHTFLLLTYITMGFLIISGLWMVVSGFVFCVPIRDFWSLDYAVHTEHCLPQGAVWFSNAAMQILTDIIILILPMPLLSKLQLPTRQKAGVMLVFGVGICVIATSSARLYELSTMVRGQDFTSKHPKRLHFHTHIHSHDPEKNAEAAVWSSIEANVSIICACLPPLNPLLSRIFSFFFLPRPLHSSRTSKARSHTTDLTESRKPSVFDHGTRPSTDGGVFFNDFFFSGPGRYSASISKASTNEDDLETADGIRVVRELRMSVGASATAPSSNSPDRDFEMEERRSGSGSGAYGTSNRTIEWDLGDFEFPDYKERMNAPI
ncbi:uncharacterized protein N7459_000357 [Penicillium hispanicum]|uniref:uncharacterized protein n=1 Tax=Penicillium hispanicum TaxID=1080232 RepID=UPI002541E988|nr:uncharacterized protein N7459_000357 [Penicillium hispanicum]KAJ5594149.1 hypothetical protein N7459_000357 [Penicillium hispanicum]